VPVKTHRIRYATPRYYDLTTTCHMHGWRHLAPFAWDEARHALTFACLVDGAAVDVVVAQHRRAVAVTVLSHNDLKSGAKRRLDAMIRRSLGLDVDTAALLAVARRAGSASVPLIRRGVGRLLRSPTLWEDAAKTLFTTNCSWTLTERMCAGLCSERFSAPTPLGRHPFPPPARIAPLPPARLRAMVPVGYRAAALRALAAIFARDPLLGGLEVGALDYSRALTTVLALRGFGPYASAHLLLLANFCDAIPMDSAVGSYVRQHFRTRNPQAFLARRYEVWRPFRWWGYKIERMQRLQALSAV
jgi:3-methyladenine DNA glycosylase/8-oxoguanine DNA glycosylase